MTGFGATDADAPEMTGFVGSGLFEKSPFTAFAIVARPEGPGEGLADRSLILRGSSGTCSEVAESFLFLPRGVIAMDAQSQ